MTAVRTPPRRTVASSSATRNRNVVSLVAAASVAVLLACAGVDVCLCGPGVYAWTTTTTTTTSKPLRGAPPQQKPRQQQAPWNNVGAGGGRGRGRTLGLAVAPAVPVGSTRRIIGGSDSGSRRTRSTTTALSAAGPAALTTSTAAAAASTHAAATKAAISTAVAGKVWPALRRLAGLVHPQELARVVKGIHLHLQPQDWIFLAVLAVVGYGRIEAKRGIRSRRNDSDTELDSGRSQPRLLSSWLQRVAVIRAVQELAQVAVLSYAVDIVCLALRLQGVHFPHLWDVPRVFAKSSFALWALRQFLRQKRGFLRKKLGSGSRFGSGASSATVDLVDKAVNVVSVAFTGLLISDWVSVELGWAFKGVVTLGSLGTLAFTLASKDLAAQIVSGMFLQAGNKMRSGEKVALGSSTGKVVKIGLTETVLRASDNTITSIPNAKVSQDKVINYSRVPVSQVAQKLRFHVEDIDVLPDVLESIRAEIKSSCPQLIVDGSRPFRVFFTDYAENCLEVMIDTHFSISPTSDEYWVNRQEVLMAIHRAVKRHRIQYAYSTSPQEGGRPPPRDERGADGRERWDEAASPVAGAGPNGDDPSLFANSTAAPRVN